MPTDAAAGVTYSSQKCLRPFVNNSVHPPYCFSERHRKVAPTLTFRRRHWLYPSEVHAQLQRRGEGDLSCGFSELDC